ncbi:MAG: LysM peptidoglycan-binding domain-containing protein [Candidatus Omnitrophota bacterium]
MITGVRLKVLLGLAAVGLLSGCTVRTYVATKDRLDQDLNTGNRGYLMGKGQEGPTKEHKPTREVRIVEMELRSPVKFEKMPKQEAGAREETITQEEPVLAGNRGYLTSSTEELNAPVAVPAVEKYTVKRGDTLQKISKKFYGTAKKWMKIYDANKEALKGPNKIYPGQVIDVPLEPLKEPSENLK